MKGIKKEWLTNSSENLTLIEYSPSRYGNPQSASEQALKKGESDKTPIIVPPITSQNLLLPYQQLWVSAALDRSLRFIACVKSRRIGLSWADALVSVLNALKGIPSFYTTFNKENSEAYIEDCKKWVEYLESNGLVLTPVRFNKFSIKFGTGAFIRTLPSTAKNFRGLQGDVIVDEAAFRDLKPVLDASKALIIWGSQIRMISTHFGTDNLFNLKVKELIAGIESGASKGSYCLHVNFRAAIAQGLYERVAQCANLPLYEEDKQAWIDEIYEQHGLAAAQELDAIPEEDLPEDAVFVRSQFQFVDPAEIPKGLNYLCAWDIAASDASKKKGFYSARVLLGYVPRGRTMYLLHACAKRLNPLEGDDFIVAIANQDGKKVKIVIEQEGGSESIKWTNYLRDRLTGYQVSFLKPQSSKLSRAFPVATAIRNGNLVLLRGAWNDEFISAICKFDGIKLKPLTNDYTDSLSLGYNHLRPTTNPMIGGRRANRGLIGS